MSGICNRTGTELARAVGTDVGEPAGELVLAAPPAGLVGAPAAVEEAAVDEAAAGVVFVPPTGVPEPAEHPAASMSAASAAGTNATIGAKGATGHPRVHPGRTLSPGP
jgi:hypothetical protein